MGTGVGMHMEKTKDGTSTEHPGFEIRMLGQLELVQDGACLALPSSRKLRGLLAYLAFIQRPVHRAQLCSLLWDMPNDPRAELRWYLSKIRKLTDDRRFQILAHDNTVRISGGCTVDAINVLKIVKTGIGSLDRAQLSALNHCFTGEFLEGLDVDGRLPFAGWLTATRRTFHQAHSAVLECLTAQCATDPDEYRACIEQWLELAPFDLRPHRLLLERLSEEGRVGEAEAHLTTFIRRFDAEGMDAAPLRLARQAARRRPLLPCPQTKPAHPQPPANRRACVVIMPFVEAPTGRDGGGLGKALAHDIITRLAKLRHLFVIARGSVFALSERGVGPDEAGRLLDADYTVSGEIACRAGRLRVSVETTQTSSGRVVWAETYQRTVDDTLLVLEEIGDDIVASIESEIANLETHRALLKPAASLDAWEAYHCGLWHMYHFNRSGNERAQHFFRTALEMDPTFSRAHAGMSFTHFQNAFLHRPYEREKEIAWAYESAGESLVADDRSPAAHWAMGRALWLRRSMGPAVGELERAVELSPNFSLGHYTLAFVRAQSGDPQVAIRSADLSLALSPFDPLLFAMLASRALAHLRLGQYPQAADWALRAVARPNVHIHVLAIAAYCLSAAGRMEEAEANFVRMHTLDPAYGVDDFLLAFHFCEEAEALFRRTAGAHLRARG